MEFGPIFSAMLRNRTGPILVAIQVALSLAILANALQIVQLRLATAARPSGLSSEADVFAIEISHINAAGQNEQLALQQREAATLRTVPGVLAVAGVNQMPLSHSGSYAGLAVDRRQSRITARAALYETPESLVQTWGLRVVQGRDFRPEEVLQVDEGTSDFPQGVMITSTLAEKLWPGQNPVGNMVFIGTGPQADGMRVIGVVDRLQTPAAVVGSDGEYSLILPMRRVGGRNESFTVHADAGRLDQVIRDAEQALRAASPTDIIIRTRTMVDMRSELYRTDRNLSWMLLTVCLFLLLITASGVIGMASLWVTQRRKQIGVRRALGARRIDILRYFLTENFMITSAGIAGGLLLALALNQLLVSTLEMARLPPYYLIAGAGLFWALGLAAASGPAWRAASISPALATRSA